MDGNTFDRMIKRLQTDGTRRQVLAGVLASAAAVVSGAALSSGSAEAKPGKGRDRGRGNGGHGKGKGKGNTKVTLCHPNGNGGFELITIGEPGSHGHGHQDDVPC